MANNLKIFGNPAAGHDTINSYAGISGAEHEGFIQNTFIYVDQINTALRNTSLVTYTLVDILSSANAVNIDTTTSAADAKSTIKSALDAYIAGTTVNKAEALTNTSAIGSSTKPVYFSSSGVPVACGSSLSVNITGNVTGNCSGSSGSCTGTAANASKINNKTLNFSLNTTTNVLTITYQ